ncbi:zeaxanthin epoxidase, chloroplastic [Hordeum vulgare]|nr:zeaxanthin epoxidase, chloroplastic [Hordeum vulgare]
METAPTSSSSLGPVKGKPRVLVAGGGIDGLVMALAAGRKGYNVTVFEWDISAVRGEGQYRGPIQIQSNALAALEAIDMSVAEEVMREGCVTGDRINGLVDGISGSWYVRLSKLMTRACSCSAHELLSRSLSVSCCRCVCPGLQGACTLDNFAVALVY